MNATVETTLIGFKASPEMATAIEKARGELGRSQWLRNAVAKKLQGTGYEVTEEQTYAPDRVGKGGKRKPEANTPPIEPQKTDTMTPPDPAPRAPQTYTPAKRPVTIYLLNCGHLEKQVQSIATGCDKHPNHIILAALANGLPVVARKSEVALARELFDAHADGASVVALPHTDESDERATLTAAIVCAARAAHGMPEAVAGKIEAAVLMLCEANHLLNQQQTESGVAK